MDTAWQADLQRIASVPRVAAPPGFVQDKGVHSARGSYVLVSAPGERALRHYKTGFVFRAWPVTRQVRWSAAAACHGVADVVGVQVEFSSTDDNVVLVDGVAELIVAFERKKSV